jgi:DNA-binding XRE family transcriptional regulator
LVLRLTAADGWGLSPGARGGCVSDNPNYSEWTEGDRARNLASVIRETTALKKRVGTRIRQKRKERGMTQEKLAFEAELSTHYLSQVEAGTRNPTLEVLYRLSIALHVDLADLLKSESRPASH